MDDRHDRIRRRAFEIWQSRGGPNDQPEDHWLEAEREIDQANVDELEEAPSEADKVAPGAVIPDPEANRR